MGDLPRDYCLLGLRFDRLIDGFVDAYFGDPQLKAQVANEPLPDPRELARQAVALRHELSQSELPTPRAEFLTGQLQALETSARKLAGDDIGYVDEVEAYFQVRPAMGDEADYAGAHAALDELLPGSGDLRDRYIAYRRSTEVPAARLEEAVLAMSSALRDRVRTSYGLPEQETIDYEIVGDKPWSGFNYYLGDYHSRVAINSDLPMRLGDIPHLVGHESYPGHHTEHCRKESLLVERERHVEQTIFLVNTPECLMAEGLADLGLHAAVGPGWGVWSQEIFADLGLHYDGQRDEALQDAAAALNSVRQDAALLLHDRGASEDDVVAYLARWGLMPEERARKSMRFLTDPLWRAYISTYVEGYRLLSAWLDARPAEQPVASRFVRLLDEPLTPAGVAGELASAATAGGRTGSS